MEIFTIILTILAYLCFIGSIYLVYIKSASPGRDSNGNEISKY